MSHLSSLFLKIASLLAGKCSMDPSIPSSPCLWGKDGITIICRTAGLELDMDRGLHITSVADDGRNLTHLWTSDSLIRIPKLRMIEDIECFHPELNRQLLANGEGLEERRVKVRAGRTKQGIASRIAVGIRRRCCKC